MSYTEYGDHFTRGVPESWPGTPGRAEHRLRMVPKDIYERPDELVRVFVVANKIRLP